MNLAMLQSNLRAESGRNSAIRRKALLGVDGQKYSKEFKSSALSMLNKANGFKAVAKRIGIAETTLRDWHKEPNK
jgi:transposase-like protein